MCTCMCDRYLREVDMTLLMVEASVMIYHLCVCVCVCVWCVCVCVCVLGL